MLFFSDSFTKDKLHTYTDISKLPELFKKSLDSIDDDTQIDVKQTVRMSKQNNNRIFKLDTHLAHVKSEAEESISEPISPEKALQLIMKLELVARQRSDEGLLFNYTDAPVIYKSGLKLIIEYQNKQLEKLSEFEKLKETVKTLEEQVTFLLHMSQELKKQINVDHKND